MRGYDVIVIGAGHAGIEASLAAARMGRRVLMVTLERAKIGLMSCNPAIGGVGKGQLVKEVDALGGEMGKAADRCAIQFRVLNASKGAAVQSSRAQIDMAEYSRYMRTVTGKQKGLDILEDEVTGILVNEGAASGVVCRKKGNIAAKSVVLSPGTFLGGVIHIGLKHQSGGRINEPAAKLLAEDLKRLGFEVLYFKTGTCPRIDKDSVDFSRMAVQHGDALPRPFSFSSRSFRRRQTPCHITYTNEKTHKVIMDNLGRSPLYSGKIQSTGVRYCPSVEDKVVKFSDKPRHQVFLEPQGLRTKEVYLNGLSTSLPEDVQLAILHSIEGLEKARVIRFGYGIEHMVCEPTQLYPTLESKRIKNLFFAGQINGTTGYEEAAAQGLVAGINAALRSRGEKLLVLDRASGYIGVLIDDLVTKGTNEPYRMFTSRVEYRLILREDNADLRLRRIGYELGLVNKREYLKARRRQEALSGYIGLLRSIRIKPTREINEKLAGFNTAGLNKSATLEEILKRPQMDINRIKALDRRDLRIPSDICPLIEAEVKYAGFIKRQAVEVERFKNIEKIKIPKDFDYSIIPSLSREIKEKLLRFKPLNLGQASRISGITPAAVSAVMVYLKKSREEKPES